MSEINTEFIALPKTYKYPEDLEDGIYNASSDINVIYNYNDGSFRVFEHTQISVKKEKYSKYSFDVKERVFSLKDWIVIYNGRLYVDSKTDIQH